MLHSLRADQLCCRGVAEIPAAAAGAAAEEAPVYLLSGEDGHQRQEHDQAGHNLQGEGIRSLNLLHYSIPNTHFILINICHVFRLTRTKLRLNSLYLF